MSDCDSEHCITCGDDGEPMTVLRVDEERVLALCGDEAGGHHTVEIALVAPVSPGDRLLVHAGTALVQLRGAEQITAAEWAEQANRPVISA